ncbi:MAG: hypothetical protein K0R80_1895 [Clostridia bacterium]|nr:hypothetical protein [Clostridia bacterium]
MDNIYRGEPVSKEDFINKLSKLGKQMEEDLLLEPLMPEVVIRNT